MNDPVPHLGFLLGQDMSDCRSNSAYRSAIVDPFCLEAQTNSLCFQVIQESVYVQINPSSNSTSPRVLCESVEKRDLCSEVGPSGA